MSTPYIKQEPDDEYDDALLSRQYLTRGGESHFDDMSSSMIDESDLLDLEGIGSSPSANLSPYQYPQQQQGYQQQQQYNNNAHAIAAASIGFSSNTPTRASLGSYPSNYGTTPPVQESTSPFDDFMLGRVNQMPQTHAQRFLQDNYNNNNTGGNNSNTSTPNNSYVSPPSSVNNNATTSSNNKISKPNNNNNNNLSSSTPDDKQHSLLAERRRKRRESHNAVERRRRDNINEKIKELCDLLPEAFLAAASDPNAYNGSKDDKPNKGTILSRSVDYIRKLQQIIDDQNRSELELQDMVQNYQRQLNQPVTEFGQTSAEIGLANLGIRSDDEEVRSKSGLTPEFSPEVDLEYYKNNNPIAYQDALNSSAIADDDY